MSSPANHYQPGQPINTRKPLQIEALDGQAWEPIERAYPEIATAGPNAVFRSAQNVTIYPPRQVSKRLLKDILTMGGNERIVYPHPAKGAPTAVLVCVVGGYASLHIFRLVPPKRKR